MTSFCPGQRSVDENNSPASCPLPRNPGPMSAFPDPFCSATTSHRRMENVWGDTEKQRLRKTYGQESPQRQLINPECQSLWPLSLPPPTANHPGKTEAAEPCLYHCGNPLPLNHLSLWEHKVSFSQAALPIPHHNMVVVTVSQMNCLSLWSTSLKCVVIAADNGLAQCFFQPFFLSFLRKDKKNTCI